MNHRENTTVNTKAAVMLLGIFALTLGVVGCDDDPTGSNSDEKPREGFVELLSSDPLRHSFDFIRVDYGAIIQENEVRNAGSHIDYGAYVPGDLRVGIQGGEKGMILDLGPDDSLAARLGVTQTVGGGQGFSHLNLTASNHLNIPEADSIFSLDPLDENDDYNHVEPHPGHVYILRIRDRNSDLDIIVKLMAVFIEPKDRVALQWVRLR